MNKRIYSQVILIIKRVLSFLFFLSFSFFSREKHLLMRKHRQVFFFALSDASFAIVRFFAPTKTERIYDLLWGRKFIFLSSFSSSFLVSKIPRAISVISWKRRMPARLQKKKKMRKNNRQKIWFMDLFQFFFCPLKSMFEVSWDVVKLLDIHLLDWPI